MNKSRSLDFILFSLLTHGILLGLLTLPNVNTSSAAKVEIELREVNTTESKESLQKPMKPPTSSKYANRGEHGSNSKENEEIDLTEYSNRVKIVVDPVWVRNINPLVGERFYVEVFVLPDVNGNIKEIKILKLNGNAKIRQIIERTFREVGILPTPPKAISEQGIIWTFKG